LPPPQAATVKVEATTTGTSLTSDLLGNLMETPLRDSRRDGRFTPHESRPGKGRRLTFLAERQAGLSP
jgi:hypothetical protein